MFLMKKTLPTLLLLWLPALLFFSCSSPQLPLYQDVENFRIGKSGQGETVVSADVKYYNPNNYRMKLKHAEVEVYINNQVVGKSILDTLIVIPKRDRFLIPVSMKVNIKDVFSNALTTLLSGEVDIKLEGFAKLGKGVLFVDVPIRYEGKQKISLDKF